MDSSGVAGIRLVVAGSDCPELFQLGEGVLDQVAPAVHVAVEVEAAFAAGFGRDHRRGAAGVEVRPDPVHIERLVAEQGVEIQTLDPRGHTAGVVRLAGQQHEAHQIAACVDQGDDLGGQAATRAPDGLALGPPLAPLALWWAVTMVPSIRAYSKSGSPDRQAKTRSNTPPFTHRRKRWKTLFHLPKAPGRSRQGTPVRTRHSTASRNSRLSFPVAPGSVGLPGSSGATFSQAVSSTTKRSRSSMPSSRQSGALNHERKAVIIPNVNRP